MNPTQDALAGLKVIDVATLFAGPLAATLLGDFGADVIKVEHPEHGDPARRHGHARDGVGLWWKMLSRNKKAITLYLGAPEGQELFRELVRDADVIIENFRPGTMERWGLGYEQLASINPRLVMVRITGFGQFGPMASRPGFGTLAESMSGFAHATGQPDGPPTLPPFGLADGITGLAAAFATMTALRSRTASGQGQQIDLAIIEPILTLLGPQITIYDQLGIVQQRTGNRSMANAPRNLYRTADSRWVAVSTSTQSVAERVARLVGRPDFIQQSWFRSGRTRAQHVEELDEAVSAWIGNRTADEVIEAFGQAEAAIAPVYDVSQVVQDAQYQALGSIVSVEDDELGSIRMQNVMFRMALTPGRIRWAGPPLGAHNADVYRSLGIGERRLADLRTKGVV